MTDSNPPIHLIIIDDHNLSRQGLKLLIEQGPLPSHLRLEVETISGLHEFTSQLQHFKPDLALLKLTQLTVGSEQVRQLRHYLPRIKILFYGPVHRESAYVASLRCGAQGYLAGDIEAEQLIPAILSVYYGGCYCAQSCIYHLPQQQSTLSSDLFDKLTPRERTVLRLISEEYSREAIAHELDVSIRTVDTYRSQLLKKLKVQSSVGLTRLAIEHGLSKIFSGS